MPPKSEKKKSANVSEKNKSKKNSVVDDLETPEIKDEQLGAATCTPTIDLITEETKIEDLAPVEEIEVKYEEPVLTLIIVERYLEDKLKFF